MKKTIILTCAALAAFAILAVCFNTDSAENVIRIVEAILTFFLGLVSRLVFALANATKF